MTLAELESQLSGLQTYTPETEDALRQRAENIYNPQYQQDLQSIRDSLQQGINQQNRNMISAGMQRSSYGQSAIAALRGQGLKAEAQLGAQRDANIANLLYQLIEGEKDRKLNADQNRDNLLLQLYQLANKGSGSGKKDTMTDNAKNKAWDIYWRSFFQPQSVDYHYTTAPETPAKYATTTSVPDNGLYHTDPRNKALDYGDPNRLLK